MNLKIIVCRLSHSKWVSKSDTRKRSANKNYVLRDWSKFDNTKHTNWKTKPQPV